MLSGLATQTLPESLMISFSNDVKLLLRSLLLFLDGDWNVFNQSCEGRLKFAVYLHIIRFDLLINSGIRNHKLFAVFTFFLCVRDFDRVYSSFGIVFVIFLQHKRDSHANCIFFFIVCFHYNTFLIIMFESLIALWNLLM